jgi:beta-lactamase regulating signal transducer with metallopeptidase domain
MYEIMTITIPMWAFFCLCGLFVFYVIASLIQMRMEREINRLKHERFLKKYEMKELDQ